MSSFRSRILWLLLAVAVLVQIATMTALVVQTNRRTDQRAGAHLASSGRILDALLSARAERLRQAVTMLADDDAFREAVASSDRTAIVAALESSAGRVDARLALLIGADGRLSASSPISIDPNNAEIKRFAASANGAPSMGCLTLGSVSYMLVAAPVHASDAVATVVFGLAIDAQLARELSSLVGQPVRFATRDDAHRWHIVDAQAQPPHRELERAIAARRTSLSTPIVLKSGDESFVVRLVPVAGSNDSLWLVLQKPIEDTLGPYARTALLGVLLLALLLAFPIARVLANATSRPLDELVNAARRIAAGNYSEPIALDAPSEFHTVAATLNSMQQTLAEREERILRQAIRDEITGLPNRAWVSEYLESRERRGIADAPLALILLQIKEFDRIRASLGHAFADKIAQEIAQRLRGFCGTEDRVARVALSEFLFIAPNIGEQASQSLARTLLQSVRAGLMCDGIPVHLDAQIGICVCPAHATHDLLRRADQALYDAGERGDAIAMYEAGRDERHRRQLAILGDLRRACDSNELELFYQPKVDMKSHAVHGLEALVRWSHPQHGRIQPSEFVPLAERTGNIALLTNWVLKTVLRQMQEWQRLGFHPDISVNLSAADLLDRELIDLILEHLRMTDAQPHRLIFEITESAVMREPGQVISVMEKLREQHVRFSIDDFGTGYSSLTQFKHLPVDEIKIDQSFVVDLARDSEDAAIVRSTIDLGHNFGVKVVAEGVETPESWRTLLELGCDLAQGYLVSRPLPAHKVLSSVNFLNDRLKSADTATQQLMAFRGVGRTGRR